MAGILKGRGFRSRVRSHAWSAVEALVHGIFDSKICKRHPVRDFKVLVLSVYRHRNAAILLPSISEAVRCGWEVRLWALDRAHPDLERYSRGVGAGSRCALLNALISSENLQKFDWIIVMDDDFELPRGSLALFLALAQDAGFSLAQPAQAFRSHRSHRINLCHPSALARLTTFVEIGPVLAVDRTWARRVLPFPEGFGMGWGLAILWSELQKEGARLGVVDWVTINHLHPVGEAYDEGPEYARLASVLKERGYSSILEVQKTLAVWRPWEPRPQWLHQ